MGVVYRARQKGLNRQVAIKMLLAGEHAGAEHFARFQAEAEAVAALQHPNIVQIYDVGQHQGLPYFSLELVPGGSLTKSIAAKPQDPLDSARLVELIARGMQHAHRAGIVHRDLKPDNILLAFEQPASRAAEGSAGAVNEDPTHERPLAKALPKINDFGLAKRLEIDSSHTRTGAIMGTPSYMAPEQARGEGDAIGPLTDVYAIGAILYHLLTGRPPFLGAYPIETVAQVIRSEPVGPRQLAPGIPLDLETICLKCLQKDRQKRYASAAELADDLRRFQRGEPIVARPVGRIERLWRWAKRNPAIAALSAAVLLFLSTTTGIAVWTARTLALKNVVIRGEKDSAKREAANAKAQEAIAKQEEHKANVAKDLAEDKQKEAIDQATLAAKTIQTLINNVMDDIGDTPGLIPVKLKLLQTAIDGAEKVTQTDESTSRAATILAAHQKLGELYVQTGDLQQAYREFEFVHQGARERVAMLNGTDAARYNLGLSCIKMSDASREMRRDLVASRRFLDEASEIYLEILAHPKQGLGCRSPFDIRFMLTEVHNRIAVHHVRVGEPAEALRHFLRCRELLAEVSAQIDDPQQHEGFDETDRKLSESQAKRIKPLISPTTATALMGSASMSFRLKKPDDAERYFDESLKIREQALADATTESERVVATWNVARLCSVIADFRIQASQLFAADSFDEPAPDVSRRHLEGAEAFTNRSIELFTKLSEADMSRADFRSDLSKALFRLGLLRLRQQKPSEASDAFDRCRKIREVFAQGEKATQKQKLEWYVVRSRCGDHAEAAQFVDAIAKADKVDQESLLLVAKTNAACAAAVAANSDMAPLATEYRDRAFAALQRLIQNGYQDLLTLELEPDFDPLRADPRFKSLVRPSRS